MPAEFTEQDATCCCHAVPCCPGSVTPWDDRLFLTAECLDPPGAFDPFSVPIDFTPGVNCYSGFPSLPYLGDFWRGPVGWPERVSMGNGLTGGSRPPRDALFGCPLSGGGGPGLTFSNCEDAPDGGFNGIFAAQPALELPLDCATPVLRYVTPPASYFGTGNWFVDLAPARLRFTVSA